MSRRERRAWQTLVESYLLPWLAARGVPVLGVLTKLDALGAKERAARLRAHGASGLGLRWIATSARTGARIAEPWAAIDAALAEEPSRSMAP